MASRSVVRSCSHLSSCLASSPARAFLQVGPWREYRVAPLPLFDFLTPGLSPTTLKISSKVPYISAKQSQAGIRNFSSSAKRRHTSAILNPKQDDDGSEMTIEITPRASNRLKEIMSKEQNPHLALRIQVESGGCHGFQYLMSLTTLPPLDKPVSDSSAPSSTVGASEIVEEAAPAMNTSSTDPNAMPSNAPGKNGNLGEDDTVFAADGGAGAKVVMDGPSLELLKGSKVDFTMELIGSQFKIVDNPLATSSCGCGTSFDIKT